jgi:hypothetical protein
LNFVETRSGHRFFSYPAAIDTTALPSCIAKALSASIDCSSFIVDTATAQARTQAPSANSYSTHNMPHTSSPQSAAGQERGTDSNSVDLMILSGRQRRNQACLPTCLAPRSGSLLPCSRESLPPEPVPHSHPWLHRPRCCQGLPYSSRKARRRRPPSRRRPAARLSSCQGLPCFPHNPRCAHGPRCCPTMQRPEPPEPPPTNPTRRGRRARTRRLAPFDAAAGSGRPARDAVRYLRGLRPCATPSTAGGGSRCPAEAGMCLRASCRAWDRLRAERSVHSESIDWDQAGGGAPLPCRNGLLRCCGAVMAELTGVDSELDRIAIRVASHGSV